MMQQLKAIVIKWFYFGPSYLQKEPITYRFHIIMQQ